MKKDIRQENEKECLEFCLGMSDDKSFHETVKKATHEERVVMLLDNGFTFGLPEEEEQILEYMYRELVRSNPSTK